MDKFFLKTAEKELEKKIDINKSFKQNKMDSLDLMTFISLFESTHSRYSPQELYPLTDIVTE